MSSILLGVMLFGFGILILTTQGFAQSVNTLSDINKMDAMEVFDLSGSTLLGLNLGTSNSITSVTLTFNSNIPDNTNVNISFKDRDGVEIGIGSTTVSPASATVVISLSDTVTDVERGILQSTSVTIS